MRWVMLILVLPVAMACIEPASVSEDAVFCSGNYTLDSAIVVSANIKCDSTVLRCNDPLTNGILLNDYASVEGCTIIGCQNGIYAKDAQGVEIKANKLINNKIGVALEDSSGTVEGNVFAGNTLFSVRSKLDDNITELNDFETMPSIGRYEEVKESTTKGKINRTETISVVITPEVMRRVLKDMIINPSSNLDKAIEDAVGAYELANVSVERVFSFNGTHTKITIEVTPNERLENISYYENIPKCVAAYITEILFADSDHEVIEADPLVMWHFERMIQRTRITYSVEKDIPEDCKKLIEGIALEARPKPRKKDTAWALIVLALVAIAVIYGARHKLNMK